MAENADFAHQVIRSGLTFIGPSPEIIKTMGDKISAINTMKGLGIPVPGSNGPIPSEPSKQYALAKQIGYPVLIKASGGGGGRGMAVVMQRHSFSRLLDVQNEVVHFPNSDIYIEKYLKSPRHVEVQVLVDHLGKVYCLGDRDCTIQRRRQKLIEEAPI